MLQNFRDQIEAERWYQGQYGIESSRGRGPEAAILHQLSTAEQPIALVPCTPWHYGAVVALVT